MNSSSRRFMFAWTLAVLGTGRCLGAEGPTLTIVKSAGRIEVRADNQPLVQYVYQDEQTPRPYFQDLKTPGGFQVSRNHPPRPGVDAEDHALLHPGLWLAFGDLNGQDSWRLKAKVAHVQFLEQPESSGNRAHFTVVNRYETTSGEPVCRERCRYEFLCRSDGWLLLWDSTFTPERKELVFGDQEEMGLGVRLATTLAVRQGGTIINSAGQRNEKQCWGQAADWCDYSGPGGNGRCGVLLMGHPSNFKRCSFHARDYGFVAANPFAEKSFGRGAQPARTEVKPGESLRLRFGVLLYCQADGNPIDAAAEFATFQQHE